MSSNLASLVEWLGVKGGTPEYNKSKREAKWSSKKFDFINPEKSEDGLVVCELCVVNHRKKPVCFDYDDSGTDLSQLSSSLLLLRLILKYLTCVQIIVIIRKSSGTDPSFSSGTVTPQYAQGETAATFSPCRTSF